MVELAFWERLQQQKNIHITKITVDKTLHEIQYDLGHSLSGYVKHKMFSVFMRFVGAFKGENKVFHTAS